MAHNLTDVDTFTSAVTVPDGGDPRTAASVEVPFQALANRSRNNKNRLDGLGVSAGLVVTHASGIASTVGPIVARAEDVRTAADFEYCDATGAPLLKSRTIMLQLDHVAPGLGWYMSGARSELVANLAGGGFQVPLPLPTGARVTLVRAAYTRAVAGGTPVNFIIFRNAHNKVGAINDPSPQEIVSNTSGTTTAPQILTTGAFTSSVVDRSLGSLYFWLAGGTTVGDVVSWIELTFLDPGPRNY